MKQGTLVEYIGGQCEGGKKLFALSEGIVYTVKFECEGKFSDGWKPALFLEECGDKYAFLKSMFRELSEANSLCISSLLKESIEQYSVKELIQ